MRSLALPVSLQCFVALTLLLAVPCPAHATTYELVTVGNAGNAPDTTGYGAVAYEYQIGKYEVTIGQYCEFLNSVAKEDPGELWVDAMESHAAVAGVSRSGSPGAYAYGTLGPIGAVQILQATTENRPITYLTWMRAARFANWMSNGQPTGPQGPATTENGAYDLIGIQSGIAPAVNRINPNTQAAPLFRIPTENEWYKAAFHKGGGINTGYWRYATQSDSPPGNLPGPEANQANFNNGVYAVTQSDRDLNQNYLTDRGAYSGAPGPYGTFDQNGNIAEWNDLTGSSGSVRGFRGGDYYDTDIRFLSSSPVASTVSLSGNYYFGLRLAAPIAVPEPSTCGLAVSGIACMVLACRRRLLSQSGVGSRPLR